MKYYQIGISAEPKIIGVKNGIHQVEINKNAMELDEHFKQFLSFFEYNNDAFWKNQAEIQKIEIPEIYATMLKKAKVTDIMGYTPNISFLYSIHSQKYIDILKLFKTPDLSLFEVKIENVFEKYFLLFFKTILLEEINFEKSLLFTGHELLNNMQFHSIKNLDEYFDSMKEFPLIKFKKISIPKSYSNLDVIRIRPTVAPFYSEKLIDTLLDFGISGLEPKYKNSITLDFY